MATKQYQYTPEAGDNAISEIGTDDIVLYVDDINKDVAHMVVQLHNEGKSIQDIQKILDKDERVTLDEADFIVEQLAAYLKISEKGLNDQESTELKSAHDKLIGDRLSGIDEKAKDQKYKELDKVMGEIGHTQEEIDASYKAVEKPLTETKPQTRGEKAAATRKANEGTKKIGTGGKAISAASVIDKLKAQAERATKLIAMVGYIEETSTGAEFPEGLVKDQIELLVKFTREVEKLKGEYINQIQEL